MAGFSNVRDPVPDPVPDPKLDTLPADVPIYYYGGHGEDVCDASGELRLATVPENCIYVTSGECGRTTRGSQTGRFASLFRDSTDRGRALLRYPYLEENLKEISRQTGFGVDSLHVHMPGSTYVVSRIYPPLSWNTSKHFGMRFSGISEKRLLEQVPFGVGEHVRDKGESELNKDSLGRVNDPEPMEGLFGRLKTVLASDRAAVHYIGRPGAENLFNRMFEGQDTVTRKDIGRYLDEIQHRMQIGTFLGLFQASVVPTQEEVRTILSDDTTALEDGVIFGYDMEYVSQVLSEKKILSSNLMRRYPGIHYNIVCRVLSEGCNKSVDPSVRRAVSNTDEQRRREALRGVGGPAERAGGRRRRTRRTPGPHSKAKRLTRKKTIVKSSR